VFGSLRIVPSADLGGVGPAQGQASVYNWSWTYSAQGLLLWLVLALAIVLPKSNRDRRILWILVPVLVSAACWTVFKRIIGATSSDAYPLDALMYSVLVGLAVLWLVAPGLSRTRGMARFLGALGILAAVAYVACLSYGIGLARGMRALVIMPIVLGLALLVAMAGAAWQGRRRGGPVRFMLTLAVWTVAGGLAVLCGYFLVMTGLASRLSGEDLMRVLPQVLLMGLILGAFLYVLNLPFMVLGFTSPFFRERLYACLGLRPVHNGPAASDLPGSASGADIGQGDQGPDQV